MNFDPKDVLQACRDWAQSVGPLPQSINPTKLLWAFCSVESSEGKNCGPRFEQAYFTGAYSHDPVQIALNTQFGRDGASSFGPMQVMLVNAAKANEKGAVPSDFDDLTRAFALTIKYLDKQLAHFSPKTPQGCAAMWNGGNPHANVPEYVSKFMAVYGRDLPMG